MNVHPFLPLEDYAALVTVCDSGPHTPTYCTAALNHSDHAGTPLGVVSIVLYALAVGKIAHLQARCAPLDGTL